jgi:hypothetical protein
MQLDDDTYLDASPSRSIGEIKLVISRTSAPERREMNTCNYVALPPLQKVHERSKKAISHGVGYVASLILYNV